MTALRRVARLLVKIPSAQNVDDDGNPVTDFKAVAKNPTFVQHEKTQQKIVAFLMGLVPRLG